MANVVIGNICNTPSTEWLKYVYEQKQMKMKMYPTKKNSTQTLSARQNNGFCGQVGYNDIIFQINHK